MLKHRSHATVYTCVCIKKKKTCGTCALSVLFVTQAIGVQPLQACNYCTRRRLSLINRYK